MSRILIEVYPEDNIVLFSTDRKNAVDFEDLTERQQKAVKDCISDIFS